jgi:hypothetical protein
VHRGVGELKFFIFVFYIFSFTAMRARWRWRLEVLYLLPTDSPWTKKEKKKNSALTYLRN